MIFYDHETLFSEWETAKCWKISGDDGPDPGTVICDDKSVASECESMFNADWLSVCDDIISDKMRKIFIENCKIDYCALKTTNTKVLLVGQFVQKCKDGHPSDILCDWKDRVLGKVPLCDKNQVWKGCATSCDLLTCEQKDAKCTSARNPISSCVCKAGFYLQNGQCVSEAACSLNNLWTSWGHWSICSESCGRGVKRRIRSCNGKGCPGSNVENSVCNTNACPVDVLLRIGI